MSRPSSRRVLFQLLGVIGIALLLLSVSPREARAQERARTSERAESPRSRPAPDPLDRMLPAPTDEGQTLARLGDGAFALGGADAGVVDAAVDAPPAPDAAGMARPPPPLDDASCATTGSADGLALCALMFAAGVFFRRR